MIKLTITTLILFFGVLLSHSQDKGLVTITKKDLQKHLKIISSHEYEGRRAGEPGAEKAAEYIAKEIASIGLVQIQGTENYQQDFNLYSRKIEKVGTFVKVKFEQGKDLLYDDIAVLASVISDTMVSNELVFIGYGYIDEESDYNDLEGLELTGKTVLMMAGKPNQEITEPYHSIGFDPEFEGLKIGRLIERGVSNIIFFSPPSINSNVDFDIEKLSSFSSEVMSISELSKDIPPFQFFAISPDHVNEILKVSGNPGLLEIENKILQEKKPGSFIIEGAKIEIHLDFTEKVLQDRNVVGIIEGSDPKLKDEYIVYCAHYDHDGVGENGEVYYGADDNGSGSVGLLELAHAYSVLEEKPKRSIVFIWFAAEERGLLGSNYYSENPLLPFEKTVACINLDMIGRTRLESDTIPSLGLGSITVTSGDSIYIIHAETSKQLIKINEKYSKELGLIPLYSMNEFMNYSDQYHFHTHGVPVLFLHTGLHSDYHTPRDTEDRIDYGIMLKATQLAYKTGFKVADKKGRLKKTKVSVVE